MKTLYLIGSICGIILAIIFCYQHRPYIERTAEIVNFSNCIISNACSKLDLKNIYDYCGKEKEISVKPQIECPKDVFCIGSEYATKQTYIPCYKSKLKFR